MGNSAFSRTFDSALGRWCETERQAGRPYTRSTFAKKIQKDEKTVDNWTRDKAAPPEETWRTVQRELSKAPQNEPLMEELDAAWREKRKLSPLDKPQFPTSFVSEEPVTAWRTEEGITTEGLVELRLHPPRSGNDEGTYYLDATLRLDVMECEQDGRTLRIGLKEAFLGLDSPSLKPRKSSLIGERVPRDDLAPKPGGVQIRPLAPDTLLKGDPFGEDHLVALEAVGEGDSPVTAELRAASGWFEVREPGRKLTSNTEAVNKAAVLDALIRNGRPKDKLGRVVLARAKLRRVPPV